MHDKSACHGLESCKVVIMCGLPLKNVSAGHEILSVTASKKVALTLGVGLLNVVRDTLLCLELVKLLPVHRYSVDIFSYSGPSGILGSDGKPNST